MARSIGNIQQKETYILSRDLNLSVITTHYVGGVFGGKLQSARLLIPTVLLELVPTCHCCAVCLGPADKR